MINSRLIDRNRDLACISVCTLTIIVDNRTYVIPVKQQNRIYSSLYPTEIFTLISTSTRYTITDVSYLAQSVCVLVLSNTTIL